MQLRDQLLNSGIVTKMLRILALGLNENVAVCSCSGFSDNSLVYSAYVFFRYKYCKFWIRDSSSLAYFNFLAI